MTIRISRKPQYGTPTYRQLWRVVDGAVADALVHHTDYLTSKGSRSARNSIVKRVTGAILGYATQAAYGRSRSSRAADNGDGAYRTSSPLSAFIHGEQILAAAVGPDHGGSCRCGDGDRSSNGGRTQ